MYVIFKATIGPNFMAVFILSSETSGYSNTFKLLKLFKKKKYLDKFWAFEHENDPL